MPEFVSNKNLIFFVGAGISVNFPTNFDDAFENIENMNILTPMSDSKKFNNVTLYKIHGCIKENKEKLGLTIREINKGIDKNISYYLLEKLKESENCFVFAGYSGSDYFDIVPFFIKHKEEIKANAVWIVHNKDKNMKTVSTRNLSEGAISILSSFQNYKTISGDTSFVVKKIVNSHLNEYLPKQNQNFNASWKDYFIPTSSQKYIYASKLYASFGMGKKSMDSLSKIKIIENCGIFTKLYLNTLRDCGCYSLEVKLSEAKKVKNRQLANAYRLNKQYLKSFFLFRFIINNFDLSTSYEEKSWSYAEYALLIRDIARVGKNKNIEFLCKKNIKKYLIDADKFYNKSMFNPHIKSTILRLEQFVNDTEKDFVNNYLETDSILGLVNSKRDISIYYLKMGANNKSYSFILKSFFLAKIIDDYQGMIKALHIVYKIKKYKKILMLIKKYEKLQNNYCENIACNTISKRSTSLCT